MAAISGNQPPITTVQQDTVQWVRDFQSAVAQLGSSFDALGSVNARNSANNYLGILAAMQTYALNADGSVGAVDGSPNPANPIVGLNLSKNLIQQCFYNIIGDGLTFYNGGGQPANVNRSLNIDELTG